MPNESYHRKRQGVDDHGVLWKVEFLPDSPIPCLSGLGYGSATEVRGIGSDGRSYHLFADETNDPADLERHVWRKIRKVRKGENDRYGGDWRQWPASLLSSWCEDRLRRRRRTAYGYGPFTGADEALKPITRVAP